MTPRDHEPIARLVRSVEPAETRVPTILIAAWLAVGLFGLTCEEYMPNAAVVSDPPECLTDDDCGLLPDSMTCCGECDPTPPFVAVPRTQIDALLLELETTCAPNERGCEPPVCKRPPPACEAGAVCRAHRCRVVEAGCSVRADS